MQSIKKQTTTNMQVLITQFRKKNLTITLEVSSTSPQVYHPASFLREHHQLRLVVLSKGGIENIYKNHSNSCCLFASLDNFTKYVCIPKQCSVLHIFYLHRAVIILCVLLSDFFFLCAQDFVPGICP